uniref:PPM-type phosphatase domain-containing protein n=1 Tax=Syphacia muris TaxID=451379 RepID=A0A0N5AL12_9BILA
MQWLVKRYQPYMQGEHLRKFTLSDKSKQKPPALMDLGLSDIPLFHGGTWRWKHKNLSFFASRGQRPYMEDRMHYMYDPYNNLLIFSIFDGHGGPVSRFLSLLYSIYSC